MNRLIVYTCVFGNYQGPVEPREAWADCEFICFTDRSDLVSDIWSVRRIELNGLESVRGSRKPKILPHKFLDHGDASLYVDANIKINRNPADYFLPLLERGSFWAPRHFERDCIFEEARECVVLGRTPVSSAVSEMKRYRQLNMPCHAGMSENNVLLRAHHQEEVIDLMERWWSLYEQGCGRDQLSLPVALMQSNFKIAYLETSSRDTSDQAVVRHQQHTRDENTRLWRRVKRKMVISARRLRYGNLLF